MLLLLAGNMCTLTIKHNTLFYNMSYMFQPFSVVIIRHEYYKENMGMYATMQKHCCIHTHALHLVLMPEDGQ